MKAVQVMMDEHLLAALDQDPEVREGGRSAAIRSAVAAWLGGRRSRAIDAAYRNGYGASRGLGEEWVGWTEEGEWPAG